MMKEQSNYIFTKEVKSLDSFALGQRIQETRIGKGIKALDMAAQLDLSKDQYSRIECGTSMCKLSILHKIAQYLEVSVDYLLYGNKEDLYMEQIRIFMKAMKKADKEKLVKILEIISA